MVNLLRLDIRNNNSSKAFVEGGGKMVAFDSLSRSEYKSRIVGVID